MIITKKALPRRTFLRGTGIALAVPFLDAMVPALTAAPKAPRRLGFFYIAMGQSPTEWDPVGDGRAFEFGPTMKETIGRYRDRSVIVTGLMNKGGESTGDGGGTHTRCASAWLSGVKPKQSEADLYAGKTADQFAADIIGRDSPLPSLELSLDEPGGAKACDHGYSCTYVNTMSWRSPTQPNPMERSPRQVFERLFGDGGTTEQRLGQVRRRRSVLDRLTAEVRQLSLQLGAGDRTAVSEYLEDIRAIEQRIQRAELQASEIPLTIDRPVSVPASYDEYSDLMYDLLALAYQADITRVSTFQIVRELASTAYPQIGVVDGHHSLSHHSHDPVKMANYAKLNRYHMGIWARFLDKLDKMREGDGSVLDHSLFLYGSGMSDSDSHDPANVPALLVGGAAGALKGGRVVRYDKRKEVPLANLLVSMLDLSGVPLDRLGDSTGRIMQLTEPLSL